MVQWVQVTPPYAPLMPTRIFSPEEPPSEATAGGGAWVLAARHAIEGVWRPRLRFGVAMNPRQGMALEMACMVIEPGGERGQKSAPGATRERRRSTSSQAQRHK